MLKTKLGYSRCCMLGPSTLSQRVRLADFLNDRVVQPASYIGSGRAGDVGSLPWPAEDAGSYPASALFYAGEQWTLSTDDIRLD